MRRSLFLLMTAFLAVGLSEPAAAQMREATEEILIARDGAVFEVTRGFVRVPERRAKPDGATIDLAVVRIRMAGVGAGRASAVLAGGPGDSGVREVLDLATQGGRAWAQLMGGEVVGMDQRGTGASRPSLASTARYGLPLDRPGSPEAWLPQIARVSSAEAARLRKEGIDLGAYNTEESADDVEAVRRALGYGKMTVWGRSYGSHLALAVLRRHPQGVERLILVSPEGPDHTWKSPAATDAVLARIAERAGAPEMIPNFRKVLSNLEREPVRIEVARPGAASAAIVIGPFDIQLVVAQAAGSPRGLAGLPASLRMAAAGDYRSIAPLVLVSRSTLGIQSAMKQAMDLSSGVSPARRARIVAEAPSSLLGEAMNFPTFDLAEAWGVPPLPDAFRANVESEVPALLIVGDLDIRTPVSNAREIAAALPNAHVLIVENAAHEFSLFGDPKLRAVLAEFVAGETVSARTVTLPAIDFQK